MARTTKSDITHAFARLARATGFRLATAYNDTGGYALDTNPIYGGTRIIRNVGEHGGQHDVTPRYTPAVFVDACDFACEVLEDMAFMSREVEAITEPV